MSVSRLLRLGSRWLKNSQSPQLDAEVLLAYITKTERSSLLAHAEVTLGWLTTLRYLGLVLRARRGVPIAYLTGKQEFYGRSFRVTKATLIPRPDTEVLVEAALALARQPGAVTAIADIGTGSGAIAITLDLELPALPVYAVETSAPALHVAHQNAADLQARVNFYHGNLLEPLATRGLLTPTTLVVANLPYLRPTEYVCALRFEPQGALIGGSDGLQLYSELLQQLKALPEHTRPQVVLLELHPPTAEAVQLIAQNTFPNCQTEFTPDLNGLPRVLHLRLA